MHKVLVISVILFVSNFVNSQNTVELRDVSFSIPSKFYHFTEKDRKLNYSAFHETGKVFTDSTDLEKFPKIHYQYFEVPEFGRALSKKVLASLNEVMTKDIPADTLIINESQNYSLAKYSIMGKSVFELKSLGGHGWLNIQYSDNPKNDKESFAIISAINSSIRHNKEYESDYDRHMKESGEHSKRAIIFLVVGLVLFLAPKLINKKKRNI